MLLFPINTLAEPSFFWPRSGTLLLSFYARDYRNSLLDIAIFSRSIYEQYSRSHMEESTYAACLHVYATYPQPPSSEQRLRRFYGATLALISTIEPNPNLGITRIFFLVHEMVYAVSCAT